MAHDHSGSSEKDINYLGLIAFEHVRGCSATSVNNWASFATAMGAFFCNSFKSFFASEEKTTVYAILYSSIMRFRKSCMDSPSAIAVTFPCSYSAMPRLILA